MTGIITIYFCFNSNITIYFIVSHIVMCNIVTYHTVQGILLTNLQDALQCIYYKYNLIKNIIEKKKCSNHIIKISMYRKVIEDISTLYSHQTLANLNQYNSNFCCHMFES